MGEIRKADPRARKKALWIVAGAALAGAAALFYLQSMMAQWQVLAETDPALAMQRALRALRVLAVLMLATMLGLAGYLYRMGAKIRDAQCFPPPGVPVIRDTPVRSGPAAVLRGRLLKGLAVAMGLAGAAAAYLLVSIAGLLANGA